MTRVNCKKVKIEDETCRRNAETQVFLYNVNVKLLNAIAAADTEQNI